MASEAGETMEVAALGRPFGLGMLYDCRKDQLVPGITLWDHDDLKKDVGERPQKCNEFEIVASESIEHKSSALDVKASLKASFLGGLVEVGGSAKYLNNSKTSKNQTRVTFKYKATTKVRELSMNHLGPGNMKHQHVFEKGLATHVVTAILYGAQAFFVFDREVSQKEDQKDIEGNLKTAINKIPCLSVEGEGSLKMEEKHKASVDKFSCSFFGDFSLEKTPTSFQEAVQVYQSLPKLLGANGENAVPVKVWLLSLTMLDSTAAKLVRQISDDLVKKSQSVLEDLSELEMRCNDALKTTTAQQFPQISQEIETFKSSCSEFKLEFQQTLAKKLPSIRGGGEEEAVLADVLRKIHSSPFNSKNLNEWMYCKEREIDTLSLTEMMKNTKVVPSENDLYKESLRAEHAVCFVFTSLGINEPYLSALSDYLRQKPENPQDPQTQDVDKEQWYASAEVTDVMWEKAELFIDFAEANQENKNIKFMAVGITNEKQKGLSIYLYKKTRLVTKNFELPSKPETVTVRDVNHNSVTLKIDPPKFGSESVTSYSVEYCVSGEEGWKQQTASKPGEVTVGDLSPNTEYMIRCRAVTSVGVGPANQVSGAIKTSGPPEATSVSEVGHPSLRSPDTPLEPTTTVMWNKASGSDEWRIVMVGRTGAGKSSSGNTILGKEEAFESDCSATSVTTHCKKEIAEVHGRKVAVIDTPGLFDTTFSKEEVMERITTCMNMSAPGPHAFLVIVQLGRFTDEEKKTVDMIKETFGEDADEYTMILFTHGDKLKKKSIDSFISINKDLQGIVKKCNKRYHVFNNEENDPEQVRQLLDKINKMIEENGGSHCTTEMYPRVEEEIQKKKRRLLDESKAQINKQLEELKARYSGEKLELKKEMMMLQFEAEARARAERMAPQPPGFTPHPPDCVIS